MQIRPDILIVITGILVTLTVPSLVYHKVRFKPALTVPEKAVETFSPATLTIAKKVWPEALVTLPVSAPPLPVPSTVLPKNTPLKEIIGRNTPPAVQSAPPKPKVSLIVHDGSGGGKAIIDGVMLKPGDTIKEWTLERIETNRVLLRGRKGTTWVSQD